jgi:hypothetical protein
MFQEILKAESMATVAPTECPSKRLFLAEARLAHDLLYVAEVSQSVHSTAASRQSGLRQPALWVAVAVLVVNDHILKGSGWVPGVITGKLSDFAWLVVAPVILAALFRLRDRAHHALVLAFFVGLFGITELSQSAADAISRWAAQLHIPCRLWADPTDLIALSVLPLTWHLMAQLGTAHRSHARIDGALGRLALGLGIFASIATTEPGPPTWTTGAYVVNRSGAGLDVRVRWTTAAIDCDVLEGVDLTAAVSGMIFDEAITYRLALDETVPLERVDPSTPTATPFSTGECQLAMVAIDGAPDTIVLVPPDALPVLVTQGEALDVPDRAVTITLRAPGFDITVGSGLSSGIRDDRMRVSACESRPAFAVSTTMRDGAEQVIASVEVGGDGCTTIRTTDGERTFLCVPEEMVPFREGEPFRSLSGDRFVGATHRLEVGHVEGSTFTSVGPFTLSLGDPSMCGGERTACGAFVVPVEVAILGGTSERSGFAVSGAASIAIGRSERVGIAPSTCDLARAELTTSFDYAALLPR